MKTLLPIAAAALLVAQPIPAAAPMTTPLKGAGISGTITLTDAPGGVLVKVDASGLTPGWHGIHFHEKADCSDAAFKMSGGHVHKMAPVVHGLLNPQSNDSGDLTNIYVGTDGKAKAELFSALVALHDGSPRATLLDTDGSAIVIHAKPDDYTTQPIGGAGDRVACAVIK